MSTIKVDTIQTTGGTEVYTAKVWASYTNITTTAVNASGNVSSLTDVGTGLTTLNFANALSSASYSANLGQIGVYAVYHRVEATAYNLAPTEKTTSALRVSTWYGSSRNDIYEAYVSVNL